MNLEKNLQAIVYGQKFWTDKKLVFSLSPVGVEDFKSSNKRLRDRMSRGDVFSKLKILCHFFIYIKVINHHF